MSGTLGTFSGSLFLFGTFTINCQHESALVGFVKKSSPRGSKFLSKNADHCIGLGGGGVKRKLTIIVSNALKN